MREVEKKMKKKIVCVLVCTLMIAAALTVTADGIIKIPKTKLDIYTCNTPHIVLVEYLTLSSNPLSSSISNQLYYLYAAQTYDFIYLSLVADRNELAWKRAQELGISDFPVVVFDGGFKYISGEQDSSLPYQDAIVECSVRKTSSINIFIEGTWTSSPCFPEIIINVLVGAIGEDIHMGRLLISVIEITSDCEDQNGRPFDYVLVDHAFDKNITVESDPLGYFEAEIIFHPDSPGCHRFNAPNYLLIATFYSDNTRYADATAVARIVPGEQPTQPQGPVGDTKGKIGETLVFKTSSFDPDGHKIKYGWDWDGNYKVDEWTKFYNSDEQMEINHIWKNKGGYTVRVKAKDEKGFESFWSNPLSITISKNKPINLNILFQKFLERHLDLFLVWRPFLKLYV